MGAARLVILFLGLAAAAARAASAAGARPSEVAVGALFTYDSTIDRAAGLAIELAVDDVNADATVLAGTKLNLVAQDTNCSGFIGIMEALELMEKNVVAVIGPQSSGIGHVISHVVNELHVPLLSFAATDPTLSTTEYPYFLRATISDYFQMNAVASIVDYYQWKTVTAIFVDDDYGRGGVSALGDALAAKRARISYKAAIPPNSNSDVINDVLFRASMMESRIMVVHVNPDTGMRIFSIANKLKMMASGYVWIVTDWLAAVLDSSASRDLKEKSHIQGLIVLRQHTPESDARNKFISKWNNMARNRSIASGLNSYGFFAYDSVWAVARAIDQFFNTGQQINFSTDPRLPNSNGSTLHLSSLKIFDGGEQLLQQLLLTNFTGLTGPVQFGSDRNLVCPAYDILNVGDSGLRLIGYWSNHSGLSVVSPEILYQKPPNTSTSPQQLYNVVWPGDSSTTPRGWVFPNNGQPLRVGVPIKASFKELVSGGGPDNVTGYCIDVFNAAIKLLPYPVPCRFVTIGDGTKNPNYLDIIKRVAGNSLDAAVGDFAIVRNGTQLAEYTQPYVEAGLLIVAPVKQTSASAWAFLKPFTLEMWCVTGALFILVGIVVWLLEHRINEEFRGTPRHQITTIFWFSFSTMFYSHRQNTVSTLGRFVLIIWLFVVLIITSSYTASLTSILTVQQLETGITGLDSLISSSLPIGYQAGKFTKRYLTKDLNIAESRLVPLNTIQEYADALNRGPKNGGVAAIVDEKPYIDIFLSYYCNFRIVGQQFTREGWGFAFQRDSPLAADMSTAILQLSESGQLQRIHDEWFTRPGRAADDDSEVGATRLGLGSFSGLFLMCALTCLFALVVYFIRICWQYNQYSNSEAAAEPSVAAAASAAADAVERQRRRPSRLGSFKELLQFVDKKEEEIRKTMKRRSSDKDNQAGGSSGPLPFTVIKKVSIPVKKKVVHSYDSVWAVARAIDQFFNTGQQINFSTDPRLPNSNGSTLHLSSLKIFDGGEQLLQQLLLTNFTGLTGPVQFGSDRNLVRPAYDILNVGDSGSQLIGYWSNYSGLSVIAPEILYQKPPNTSSMAQRLHNVVWPGDSTTKPKGWVFPNNGRPLRVGVPIKASFKELVAGGTGPDNVTGYCIDIFNAAVKLLPYPVPCQFITIGDGTKNPNYDDIINMVAANSLDAAVGDFAIVRNRTKIAEFTQPYIESGLVIVAPVKQATSSAWAFLKPFTLEMWCVTGALFIFVGIVVWILEHRTNEEFRGSPRRQCITIFWFSFSTMFFSHRQNTVSALGRFVLIIWLFVVLIINSSYTASLTSILTVQQLATGITGLDSLISSALPIGYQAGKFTRNYLIEELNIPEYRLVPLNTIQEYADVLKRGPKEGGVAAIIDEMPYVDIFLSYYCNFRVVGQEFTKEGWGFAFQRDSPLAADMSTAILQLSESGQLQRIHDEWFTRTSCSSDDSEVGPTRLGLGSFWGLFLVCALICLFALLVFFIRICWQYSKYSNSEATGEPSATAADADAAVAAADAAERQRRPSRLGSFKDLMQFVDKKEEEVRRTMKRRSSEKDNQAAGSSDAHSVASA